MNAAQLHMASDRTEDTGQPFSRGDVFGHGAGADLPGLHRHLFGIQKRICYQLAEIRHRPFAIWPFVSLAPVAARMAG